MDALFTLLVEGKNEIDDYFQVEVGAEFIGVQHQFVADAAVGESQDVLQVCAHLWAGFAQ